MLQNTFVHIPGVGPAGENRLWHSGVRSWDQARTGRLAPHIHASLDRLERGDLRYFADRLGAADHWRLFGQFQDTTAYLDIETTGLSAPDDHITTIALYDGRTVRHYVHGHNLDDFAADVAAYRLLVTYNGKTFDVPFIQRSLGLRLPQAHIDLRYVLRSLGYSGGLKGCERKLGISRGDLADVDGYLAVLLWHDYRRGNRAALQTLLAYNIEDVLNLHRLLVIAYNLKLAGTPFAESHKLADPVVAKNPFRADGATLRRMRATMGGWH